MRASHFLIALAASIVLAILVIAVLPRLGIARAGAEVAWTEDLYIQKTRIASAVPGSRILVVGGSSTLFSFDAKVASRVIGKPVTNFGTHAGLGMAYILDRISRVMRRGDIIVLVPEYEFLQQSDEPNELAIQLADFYDPSYVSAQPLYERPRYWLGYDVLPSIAEGMRWLVIGPPPSRTDVRLDKFGDERGNTIALSKGADFSDARPALRPVTSTAIALLRKFMQRARNENITVFAMPPALISTPGYHSVPFHQFQTNLPALFLSLGIIPVGNAEDTFLPPSDIYDSPYHANDRGRANYTVRMLHALCQKIACSEYYKKTIGN